MNEKLSLFLQGFDKQSNLKSLLKSFQKKFIFFHVEFNFFNHISFLINVYKKFLLNFRINNGKQCFKIKI